MSDTTTRTEERAAAERPSDGRGGGRAPLFRNAYALMLNTGISAVLGLGFWLAAARYYAEDAVGQGSAAIAAMKLLAGLTAVTLTGALARFIPVAGRTTGRLVCTTYAASSVVVALATVVFLLTLDTWGPSYRFLHGSLHGLGFLVAVVGWSLLTLQDGVLTGLRSAFWVPVGNTAFSAAKLLLLIALAAAIPTAGVFVSWVASIAVSVLPLGWLVFRRLVPRHIAATKGRARPAGPREMGRFLAGDYTGSLFSLAVVYAVPVLVAAQVSAADNAYFYITTTIGGTTNLLAVNMGSSLTVEGSHDPARLAENCRAALRRMACVMIPVCLFLFVFAPQILGVFGDGYAEAAAPLLRWFAVGAALRVVIEVYFAVLRAQSRTSGLAVLQGLLCVLVLGLTLLLLPRMGLTGAGVAEISSLSVIASIAAVRLRRVLKGLPGSATGQPSTATKQPPPPPPALPEQRTAPDGDLADLAVDGDRRPGRPGRRHRRHRRDRAGYGTRWAQRAALDTDTLVLGVRMDFPFAAPPPGAPSERRPSARYGPQAPATEGPSTAEADRPVPGDTGRMLSAGRPESSDGVPGTDSGPRSSTDRMDRPAHEPGGERSGAADGAGVPASGTVATRRESAEATWRWPFLAPPHGEPSGRDGANASQARSGAGGWGRGPRPRGRQEPGIDGTASAAPPAVGTPVAAAGGSRAAGPQGRAATEPAGPAGPAGQTASAEPPRPRASRGTVGPADQTGLPAAEPAGRRAGWRTGRVAAAALWAVAGVGLGLYWLPLLHLDDADLDRMGGLGLVSVLPRATLLGAALLIVAFAGALWLARPRPALLTAVLLATVVSLHAVPAVLEAQPRFPTAWQHLGFLDYIGRTGHAVPDLDARWSWPGFFAGAAFLARAAGVHDLSEVLRWWPTLLQLLCLAPLMVLLRALRASWRAKWTAVWLFALCGWVGQDYFSPQGFTYLLYLVFVAVLLVWFREPRPLPGKSRPGEAEVARATPAQRTALLGLLIALFAASVAAHQLTPFVMLGVVSALVLLRRSNLYGLPLLCGVMVAVWVGFLAEPYWSGHWNELFGGVGGVGGNVSSSVSGRIEGGSSVHKLVLYVRVALAGGVLTLACWGVLRRRAAGFAERSLLVLTFVPFLGFGMQSYGGEMALRVFMFALPGACVLGALAVFPRVGAARAGLGPAAALLAGLALMAGFLVARWGNETFERVRPGEVAAMEYVYAHDKPTVRVLWMSNDTVNNVTPAMPWGARDMERVRYEPTLAPRDPVLVGGLVTALREAGPRSYLMVGRGQSTYLTLDSGYDEHWQERLRRSLDRRAELRRVFGNEDAALYELKRQPRGPVAEPAPGPAGPLVTWTPWSLVGALAAVALMVLLAVREVVRVAVRPSVRRLHWLQGSFWFALPLLIVVVAALVQRFVTMA
ncbi:lipopolysaccharide biosynthesis protein [Streptomyces malaysiensis subsp. malaysiensis]|uniref:lipopolysaccharide biosynthesis protein n=1 Tax=Streptomyces malaysiensis TaxID=92644 RepID=UPI00115EF804|nr:lipopolysaccharide biosynthesis protein [Streptomyces malaysiensis]QDL73719.1 lipopolysaccharide biosynthesis protein [Streptomyces malaysiensis]